MNKFFFLLFLFLSKNVFSEINFYPNSIVIKHEFSNELIISSKDSEVFETVTIKLFKVFSDNNTKALEKFDVNFKKTINLQLSKTLEEGKYTIIVEFYNNNSPSPSKIHKNDFEIVDKKVLKVSDNSFILKFLNKRGNVLVDTKSARSTFPTTPSGIGSIYKVVMDLIIFKHSSLLKISLLIMRFTNLITSIYFTILISKV